MYRSKIFSFLFFFFVRKRVTNATSTLRKNRTSSLKEALLEKLSRIAERITLGRRTCVGSFSMDYEKAFPPLCYVCVLRLSPVKAPRKKNYALCLLPSPFRLVTFLYSPTCLLRLRVYVAVRIFYNLKAPRTLPFLRDRPSH